VVGVAEEEEMAEKETGQTFKEPSLKDERVEEESTKKLEDEQMNADRQVDGAG
jgi:hypothetical protein